MAKSKKRSRKIVSSANNISDAVGKKASRRERRRQRRADMSSGKSTGKQSSVEGSRVNRSGCQTFGNDPDDYDEFYGWEHYAAAAAAYGHGYGGARHTYTPRKPVDPEKKLLLEKVMVGHFIEEVPEDCTKSVCFVMQGDGLYERRITSLATFVTRIKEVKIPGLRSPLEPGIVLNVPLIPASFLGTTVAFFRRIYKKHSSEVFLQFYFDKETKRYELYCPEQTVGAASVRYQNDENFDDTNKILVFEIHSHGDMGAFFSGTDDNDEKADRFYGVIGNISQHFPDLKLRLSVGGRRTEVEVEDIFDLNEEMYHAETYPEEWLERIKEVELTYVKGGNKWGPSKYTAPHAHKYGSMPHEGNIRDPEDTVRKRLTSEDLLTDPEGPDVGGDNGGYYAQEGKKLFWIENDKKVWYMEDGDEYYLDEEEQIEVTGDEEDLIAIDDLPESIDGEGEKASIDDPTDHREKVF